MSDQPSGIRPVEPDPVLHLVEIFLGAATTLFVELALLLPPRWILYSVMVAILVAAAVLGVIGRPKWFAAGMILGVVVPVLYVQAFIT